MTPDGVVTSDVIEVDLRVVACRDKQVVVIRISLETTDNASVMFETVNWFIHIDP